ncbi:hypothetical protein JHK85_037611 [Glycine max]|nr:hypothetical protein JHK85_037611 [Glycine max]
MAASSVARAPSIRRLTVQKGAGGQSKPGLTGRNLQRRRDRIQGHSELSGKEWGAMRHKKEDQKRVGGARGEAKCSQQLGWSFVLFFVRNERKESSRLVASLGILCLQFVGCLVGYSIMSTELDDLCSFMM